MPVDTATSKTTVNLVIIFLGVFAILALAAVYGLIDSGKSADKVAIIVGPMGVALGAVAGVLASTRSPVAAQIDVQATQPTTTVGTLAIAGRAGAAGTGRALAPQPEATDPGAAEYQQLITAADHPDNAR